MSYVAGKDSKEYEAPQAKSHKIRITLTAKNNVKNLEKVCRLIFGSAASCKS